MTSACLLFSALCALAAAFALRRQVPRLGRALLAADAEARRLAAALQAIQGQKDPTLPAEFEGFVLQPLAEPDALAEPGWENADLCPIRFAPAQVEAAWNEAATMSERDQADFGAAIAQATTVARLNMPTDEACFGPTPLPLAALRRGGGREELIAAGAAPIEAEEMLRLARQRNLSPAPTTRHLASI